MSVRSEEVRREIRHRRVMRITKRYWFKTGINVFICWHLFALVMWSMPQTSALVKGPMSFVRPYMTYSGFMQGWLMFAPTPYTLDIYVEARVTYADETERSWQFPRMWKMDSWTKYGKERWRKYVEVASQDAYQFHWPSMARFAARQNNIDPRNPPVSVQLIRHYRTVSPPGAPEGEWSSFPFHTEKISPEDLR